MGARSLAPRRWPVVAVLAVLALGTHLWGLYRVTGPPTPPWFTQADKLEHLVGFGAPLLLVLAALDLRARCRGRRLGRVAIGVSVAAFALHGVVSELIQHAFCTTRTGDPLDTLADWAGVALGLLGFLALRRGLLRPAAGDAAQAGAGDVGPGGARGAA